MQRLKEIKIQLDKTITWIFNYDGITEKKARILLIGILAMTFLIRIVTIQTPGVDRTDWKEIDHVMISKNYYEEGYNFLYPKVSWPAEEPRITAVELPLVAFMASLLYPVFGINAFSIRLITLISFLLLVLYMYKLVRREKGGVLMALITAFFAGLLPMFSTFRNYLYSEPLMIFLAVFSIYQFAQWVEFQKRLNLFSFIVAFSIAIALKPTVLCILIPLSWISFREYQFQLKKYWPYILAVGLALTLPAFWYLHAYYLAKNYIDVFGVFGGQFGGHDKFQTFTMLSQLEWYLGMYWRLKIILLGEIGLVCIFIGIITALRFKKGNLFLAYLLGIICFFIIVAEGNKDTSYRQLTIIPPASFLLGLGTIVLFAFLYLCAKILFSLASKKMAVSFAGVIFIALFAIFPIRKKHAYPPFDPNVPAHEKRWLFAQAIKKVASDTSKIILAGEYTIHKGGNDVSPVTYYYSDLRGWTIQKGQWNEEVVEDLKKKGADLLGAIDYFREPPLEDFLNTLSKKYKILYANPEKNLLLLNLKEGPQGGQ